AEPDERDRVAFLQRPRDALDQRIDRGRGARFGDTRVLRDFDDHIVFVHGASPGRHRCGHGRARVDRLELAGLGRGGAKTAGGRFARNVQRLYSSPWPVSSGDYAAFFTLAFSRAFSRTGSVAGAAWPNSTSGSSTATPGSRPFSCSGFPAGVRYLVVDSQRPLPSGSLINFCDAARPIVRSPIRSAR